ncbi:MAG TPA: lysylphosphatidylglycerol synthase transmembrane domain-containing protein [Solirubrobacteraceae bacterium]|jgi:uncharacterized membrane protein YbhN (UPF0104 family)|nr:lysylphosphatidylglycerol synthase transmembrane domain-containing protein [Solirubrobacteraceae bacterium]
MEASTNAAPPHRTVRELARSPDFEQSRVRRNVIGMIVAILLIVAVITLVPGLASLRDRLAKVSALWLSIGVALKILSGFSYVAVFRSVFCVKMRWRTSAEIGLSELGANAVLPTGGAGGLALGAWALHRSGMSTERIARRSVAFFLLTSIPNVLGVVILGLGLAVGIFEGRASLALTIIPAAVAAGAIALAIAAGRWADAAAQRLEARSERTGRLPATLRALADGVADALWLLRRRDPWLIVGLIGYLAFDVMILWATFHAFGHVPPLAIIWIGYLIGELGGLIPVPGGIGGVDLGLIGTLALYHVSLTSATAAVLAYRALALVVPFVVGVVAGLFLRRSLASEAVSIANCEPGGEVEIIGRGVVRVPS